MKFDIPLFLPFFSRILIFSSVPPSVFLPVFSCYTSSPRRKILVVVYCWHTGRSGLSVTIPEASPNFREELKI